MQDVRLVYKTFATLYFIFVFDSAENELAMLDLMQGATLFNLLCSIILRDCSTLLFHLSKLSNKKYEGID